MRKLPLLLALLLLAALGGASSAPASPLPLPAPVDPFVVIVDEEEAEAEEAIEEEEAEPEALCPEEEAAEEPCEEEAEEPTPEARKAAQECALKSAKAAINFNPGKRRLRLTVHYRTWKPATVDVAASLTGPKGAVHLGTEHARFRRSGVYRDTFSLAEKKMKKALAAEELKVDLHVDGEPASCALELTKASPRAKR